VKLKPHPFADTYPMMSAAELDALTEDIKTNGQAQPIIMFQGQVLDGRNRLAACQRAGVEPSCKDFDGDEEAAKALVRSLNDHRREMSPGKWALVAARQLILEGPRKPGPRCAINNSTSVGRGSLDVSRHFRVGKVQVEQAKALLSEAPDLVQQIDAEVISLAAAYGELQERRTEAVKKAKDMERIAEYRERVVRGEMTFDQAMQLRIEEEREERERIRTEADARQTWLEKLGECLAWVERFIAQRDDEHLAWYTEPDSPGLFDHGITAERIEAVVAQLERARTITFGGDDVRSKTERRSAARTRSS